MKHGQLSVWGYCFLAIGLAVQAVTCWWAQETWLSVVSGCLGICSVVLCAEGSIWTYLFGFSQIATYSVLCWQQHLYGTLVINAYYFVTMIYGVWCWQQRLVKKEGQSAMVQPRRLPLRTGLTIVLVLPIVSYLAGYVLAHYTNDTAPYLDAFTTVPAFVGQVLLIMAYREQWIIWLTVDVLYVVLWVQRGDGCMVAQHVFWCMNCIYGWVHWSQSSTPNQAKG